MLIPKHRCLFVHIPKTAGKSLQRFFGVPWQHHMDLARCARTLDRCDFEAFHKFAVVRNPWDRMLSEFTFQSRKRPRQGERLHVLDEAGRQRGFSEWLEAVLSDPYRYPASIWGGNVSEGIHRWSPQVDWLSIDGELRVDTVLRFERLEEDFAALSAKLGIHGGRLPCRNWTLHWHYSRYYDEPSRRRVAEFFDADIRAFGYRFEDRRHTLQGLSIERLGTRVRGLLMAPFRVG